MTIVPANLKDIFIVNAYDDARPLVVSSGAAPSPLGLRNDFIFHAKHLNVSYLNETL